MRVVRILATVIVTERITATSSRTLICCETRCGRRSVWRATSLPTQIPRTIDQRTDGSRIARANAPPPSGADQRRRSVIKIARRSSASSEAATNAKAGHASCCIAVHAIVVESMSQRRLFYGWVVVFAAATVVAFGQGSLFSLGVFLKPLEDSMRWSRSAVSVTALLNWLAMGIGSFCWGALSDRLGSRFVTISGGLLLGLSLVLSSQAVALWHLHATFGLGVGFAAGAFLT